MKKITGSFQSASGLCRTRFYIYTPEKPKAAVMYSHGMCEYIERYEEFAKYLCDNDIAFCGCDNLGHGASVAAEDMLGYFGHEKGPIYMVRDLRNMRRIMEQQLPDIPYFLIGHSMGSFLARIFLSRYDFKWNGAIFTGSAGAITGAPALYQMIEEIIRRRGEHYRHLVGTKAVFGIFNLRTANYRTPYDWLSRSDDNVDRFMADPKCHFIFTLAGYRDMLWLLSCCNTEACIENTPRDVPILFLSGGMDPVGEYGAGVRRACEAYRKHGCDAKLRIYREARHELLFELNSNEVRQDILKYFINRI